MEEDPHSQTVEQDACHKYNQVEHGQDDGVKLVVKGGILPMSRARAVCRVAGLAVRLIACRSGNIDVSTAAFLGAELMS